MKRWSIIKASIFYVSITSSDPGNYMIQVCHLMSVHTEILSWNYARAMDFVPHYSVFFAEGGLEVG